MQASANDDATKALARMARLRFATELEAVLDLPDTQDLLSRCEIPVSAVSEHLRSQELAIWGEVAEGAQAYVEAVKAYDREARQRTDALLPTPEEKMRFAMVTIDRERRQAAEALLGRATSRTPRVLRRSSVVAALSSTGLTLAGAAAVALLFFAVVGVSWFVYQAVAVVLLALPCVVALPRLTAARRQLREARKDARALLLNQLLRHQLQDPRMLGLEKKLRELREPVLETLRVCLNQYLRHYVNRVLDDRAAAEADEIRREREDVEAEQQARDERLARMWSSVFDPLDVSGLDEPYKNDYFVAVDAHGKVERLLRSHAIGSIGIAGPRGVGKTTLLQQLTAPADDQDDDTLRVYAAAPVEYSGRDFVLHLWATVCQAVIGPQEKSGPPVPVPPPGGLGATLRALVVGRWSASQAVLLAAVSMTAYLALPLVADTRWPALIPAGLLAVTAGARLASVHRVALMAMGDSDLYGNPLRVGMLLTRAHRCYGPLVLLALWMAAATPTDGVLRGLLPIAGFLVCYAALARAHEGWGSGLRLLFGVPPASVALEARGLLARREPPSLVTQAHDHLDTIRFQLSYSSGWSGSLSAGIPNPAVTMSVTNDFQQTWSENQRTTPEIVAEFRSFLAEVALARDGVVIAIDEVDKIDDPVQAKRFVNDLKAVFGVARVHVVVSVSEDALTSYERRGIDIRSDFDSAFDQIVRMPPLRLSESKALLDRRVVDLALPFVALSHCAAGGLPRDLFRTVRALVDLRASNADRLLGLTEASSELIGQSTRSMCRWLLSADDGQPSVAAGACTKLLAAPEMTLDAMTEALQVVAQDVAAKPASEIEIKLVKFACFLYWAVTILEFFDDRAVEELWRKHWDKHNTQAGPDQLEWLVAAFMSIGNEPVMAWRRVSMFRAYAGLPAVSLEMHELFGGEGS